jgi:hypothetical protein
MHAFRRIVSVSALALSIVAAPWSQASGGAGAFRGEGAVTEAQAVAVPLLLRAGEWRGVVAFDGGPVRFSLAVDSPAGETASILVSCSGRAVASSVTIREGRGITLSLDPVSGERLEGEVEGGSYVGYYHPPLPAGLARTFPFRAAPVESPVAAPADFSGEWVFVLERAEARGATITALVGQGRSKVHALWKEPDGTTRCFTGLPAEDRLVLEEMGGGKNLVLGRGDPATGTLHGEFVTAQSRVKFSAHRRPARPVINLAGR